MALEELRGASVAASSVASDDEQYVPSRRTLVTLAIDRMLRVHFLR